MINIRHSGLYVSDLPLMTEFYKYVFELYVICDSFCDKGAFIDELSGQKNATLYITKLITEKGKQSGSGDMLELIRLEPQSEQQKSDSKQNEFTATGSTHLCFEVNDIHEVANRILEKGGIILVEPFQRENENWLAFADDLEGNHLELIQRKSH